MRADPEDLKALKSAKKAKLQPYEQSLKRFEYREALDKAVESKNPEVVVALLEDLCERGGVHQAVAMRSEDSLCLLMEFLVWKVADHRYCQVLLPVTRMLVEMYAGVFSLSKKAKSLLHDLEKVADSQIQMAEGLLELDG